MSAPPPARPVDRWLLSGRLVTAAPLALRTGDPEERPPRGAVDRKGGDAADAPEIWGVDLDVNGDPFIPGTALKAALRRILAQALGMDGADVIRTLLGDAPRNEAAAGEAISWGGRAEVRNAYLAAGATPSLPQRGRTAIDDGARVAAEGLLRTQRIVPPGAAFCVEIVLDRVGEREAAYLLQALERLDRERIGSGAGAGYGKLAWAEPPRLCRMDAAAIAGWLAADGGWRDALSEVRPGLLDAHPLPDPADDAATLRLELAIEGFFVVGSGEKPEKASGAPMRALTAEGSVEKNAERCVTARAYLPGTSLKGALRAQSERIWRTLTGDDEPYEPGGEAPKPVERLYGSTRHVGLLAVSDFTAAEPEPAVRHEMVAIDRFTGGAAEGLKYAVEAFARPTLKGALVLRRRRRLPNRLAGVPGEDPKATDGAVSDVERAAVGLLALTLRDLYDGDIPLGWGTRKGYGAVTPDAAALHGALLALGRALVRWEGDGDADASDEAARAAVNAAVAAFRAEAEGKTGASR